MERGPPVCINHHRSEAAAWEGGGAGPGQKDRAIVLTAGVVLGTNNPDHNTHPGVREAVIPPPLQSRVEQHAAVARWRRPWRRREHWVLNLRGSFSAQVSSPDARGLPLAHRWLLRYSLAHYQSDTSAFGAPPVENRHLRVCSVSLSSIFDEGFGLYKRRTSCLVQKPSALLLPW